MPALRQLAAFEAVAAELHFGRAADRLGIGQAAVSQLVRRLEQEHGVVLFERSSHHVALTAAGAELLAPARRALAAGRAFDDAARAASAGESGVVRVAPADATARSLSLIVRRFAEACPRVQVELTTIESSAKTAALLNGTIDLAFARAPDGSPGVHVEPVWTEPLVALVPSPLAARMAGGAVVPEALADVPLTIIGRHRHPAMHDELLAQCRAAGIASPLGAPLPDPREGIATIAAGQGWTLTARSIAPQRAIDGVAAVPFADPAPTTTISLMWRVTGASRHALAFAAVARETAESGALPA